MSDVAVFAPTSTQTPRSARRRSLPLSPPHPMELRPRKRIEVTQVVASSAAKPSTPLQQTTTPARVSAKRIRNDDGERATPTKRSRKFTPAKKLKETPTRKVTQTLAKETQTAALKRISPREAPMMPASATMVVVSLPSHGSRATATKRKREDASDAERTDSDSSPSKHTRTATPLFSTVRGITSQTTPATSPASLAPPPEVCVAPVEAQTGPSTSVNEIEERSFDLLYPDSSVESDAGDEPVDVATAVEEGTVTTLATTITVAMAAAPSIPASTPQDGPLVISDEEMEVYLMLTADDGDEPERVAEDDIFPSWESSSPLASPSRLPTILAPAIRATPASPTAPAVAAGIVLGDVTIVGILLVAQ